MEAPLKKAEEQSYAPSFDEDGTCVVTFKGGSFRFEFDAETRKTSLAYGTPKPDAGTPERHHYNMAIAAARHAFGVAHPVESSGEVPDTTSVPPTEERKTRTPERVIPDKVRRAMKVGDLTAIRAFSEAGLRAQARIRERQSESDRRIDTLEAGVLPPDTPSQGGPHTKRR